jgi:hypothetical protein
VKKGFRERPFRLLAIQRKSGTCEPEASHDSILFLELSPIKEGESSAKHEALPLCSFPPERVDGRARLLDRQKMAALIAYDLD